MAVKKKELIRNIYNLYKNYLVNSKCYQIDNILLFYVNFGGSQDETISLGILTIYIKILNK